jgi:predicted metal-dependent hydrolase
MTTNTIISRTHPTTQAPPRASEKISASLRIGWVTLKSMSTPVDGGVDNLVPAAASAGRVTVCDVTASEQERTRGDVQVDVRRSARRRRTVSAYRDGDRIVVMIPARFTRAQEADWVARMIARLDRGTTSGRTQRPSDIALARRAAELSASYLPGRPQPASVRWVANMSTRWASCTPADGTIRMSVKLRQFPAWVQDYVLLHELAHLLVPGHGPRFWALLEAYPRTERARGYLDGVSAAAGLSWNLDEDVTTRGE